MHSSAPSAPCNPRAAIVYDRLTLALRFLGPGEFLSPLQTVSIALQSIMAAVYVCEPSGISLAAATPKLSAQVAKLLHESAPRVADVAGQDIMPERIYFALGAACGLLTADVDTFRADRLDYAGMLSGELMQLHHSRTISARGFPLLREVRIEEAWSAPRHPNALVH